MLDAELSLKGAALAPAMRLSVNGFSGEDNGVVVPVAIFGAASLRVDVAPSGPSRPIQLSASGGMVERNGLVPVLLAPELPLIGGVPDASGRFEVNVPALLPSLAGLTVVIQAFQATPFALSEALTVAFVP